MRQRSLPYGWTCSITIGNSHSLPVCFLEILDPFLVEFSPGFWVESPEQSGVHVTSFDHDYLLKSNPLVYLDEQGKSHGVIPDTIINFAVPKHRMVWVELERDSHSKKAFIEKFTNIYHVIAKGVFEQRYHTELVKVCFVSTVDNEHVAWMRMIARQQLQAITNSHVNPRSYRNRLFHFGRIPPLQGEQINPAQTFLEPYWLHPFDLEGEKETRYPLIEL